MANKASAPETSPPRRARGTASTIVIGGAVIGAIVLIGAAALWIRYGTAVFFEMIASGIAACI
jgi:hypothetical protein